MFIAQGVQYNSCTKVDGENGQPWCSTRVDSTGEVGSNDMYRLDEGVVWAKRMDRIDGT